MNLSQILHEMMEREGKKKQVNRAQMKEILGVISDIVWEVDNAWEINPAFATLMKNGQARAKRRKRK